MSIGTEQNTFTVPANGFHVNGRPFGQQSSFEIPGKKAPVYFGPHLGVDFHCGPGASIFAIAPGMCLYREVRKGSSNRPYQWGGMVVIGHGIEIHDQLLPLLSIYGHLTELDIRPGDFVTTSQVIGKVAEADTPENGLWPDTHLHLGCCLDVNRTYQRDRLPGFAPGNKEQPLRRLVDYVDPSRLLDAPDTTLLEAFQKLMRLERR
jgi:hypothetical protein